MLASYKVAKASNQFAHLKPLSTHQKMDRIMMQLQILVAGGSHGAFQTIQAAQPSNAISEEQERQEAIAILNGVAPPEARLPSSSSPAALALVPANAPPAMRGESLQYQRPDSDDDFEIGAEIQQPSSPLNQNDASQQEQLFMTPSGATHSRSALGSRAMFSPNGSHYNMMYTMDNSNGTLQSQQPPAPLPAPPPQTSNPSILQHPNPSSQHPNVATMVPHQHAVPTQHMNPLGSHQMFHPLPQSFVPNAFTALQPHIASNPHAAMAWAPTGHQDMMMAAFGGMQQNAPIVSDQLVQAVANQIVTIISEQYHFVPTGAANVASQSAHVLAANPAQHAQPETQMAALPCSSTTSLEQQRMRSIVPKVPTIGAFSSTGVTGIYNWWTGKTINSRINGKSPKELEEDDAVAPKERTSWRSGPNGKQNFSDLKKCIDAINKKALSMANLRQKPVTEEEAAKALDDEFTAYNKERVKGISFFEFVKKHGCKLPEDE